MKSNSIVLFAGLYVLGLCGTWQIVHAAPAPRHYTIEQLMASNTIGGLFFSPDDSKVLLSSTRSGAANLYSLPVSGGTLLALTNSPEPLTPYGYFPHDERILYAADSGGNELTHLFVRELDGSTHDVTPGPKLRARFVGWAPDGRSFFAATNERDARFFDLYEYDTRSYARHLLFQNDASYQIRAVSPDRRYVAVSRIVDNANTYAYLYDTRTKSLKRLTPDHGAIVSEPQVFSPDGTKLYLTTDAGREFQYLVRLDLETATTQTVFQTDWDVEGAQLSHDGHHLVVALDADAHTKIRLIDPESLAQVITPSTGVGTTTTFTVAHNGRLAGFVQANGDAPGDVFLLDLKTGKQRLVLSSRAPGVEQKDLVPGEVTRFSSYDGLVIPGVLYVPHALPKNHEAPAVVWVHGGPGGESTIGYTPAIQFLVNNGYVVYAINNRGSSGSGRTFNHLDDHKHGDADLDDVVASKKMLIATGYVAPSRIAVVGGSYGGYMTLAALAFRPNAFAAGVDMYGVANWPRLLRNTPAWWEDLRRFLATEMGDVEKDAAYLQDISPISHVDKIVKPLLVLQGANDPRVLQQESDDIVAQVRARGVPVEYVVFPDEGHGFRKKANEITAFRTMVAFLDKYVKSAPLSESDRLSAFFESVFERDLQRSPIRESRLGIKTHQDQWDDISEARQIADAQLTRGDLEELRRFVLTDLTPADQLSYRLFERDCQQKLLAFRWRRNDYLMTQMGGLHRTVATTLLNSHSITTTADAEAYIVRLRKVEPLMRQEVEELMRQEKAGVQPPRFVYSLLIDESRKLLEGRPFDTGDRDSPLLADFTAKLAKAHWEPQEVNRLTGAARAALLGGFGPGYGLLITHLTQAQKRATDDDGVWKLPQGDAYYRYSLESYTTVPTSPQELHSLGLAEVARIQEEMRALMPQLGFTGTLQELFAHMRTDRSLYYQDSGEGRAQYLADAKSLLDEARRRESEVFGLKPKIDVEVRPVEAWREKAAAKAFYSGPPPGGSRPGIFYINLYDMGAAPKYQLPVTLYHEAIPGHHVETVVAYELTGLPRFRRFASVAAFSEGWGLYAERLAKEMGLYRDVYADFGRLSLALMRAARLVVDTGIHSMRWTRAQAIDYLDANMPSSHYDNQREIERYIVLPGQATSYMVGMMKIIELREHARAVLGARFDLKAFHDVVLGSGPLPLPLLEENVNAWLKATQERNS